MDDFVRSDWFVQTQVSQIRDDFVRSHVCGCASAALDDIDDEVSVMFVRIQQTIARDGNRLKNFFRD